MEKKCGNCGNYETFYSKAYCEFVQENYGYCWKEQKVKQKGEICDLWRKRNGSYRKIDKPIVLRALEKGLRDISVLAQIFTEEKDDGTA